MVTPKMAARAAMMAGKAHTVLISGTSAELFTYRGVTEMPSMQPIGLAAGGRNVPEGYSRVGIQCFCWSTTIRNLREEQWISVGWPGLR